VVVDRLVKKDDDTFHVRLTDSLRLAQEKSNGSVTLYSESAGFIPFSFQSSCPICDFHLEELILSHFSFNSHHGACEVCHGLGFSTQFHEKDIINPRLSLAE